jgi:hypothetical protein
LDIASFPVPVLPFLVVAAGPHCANAVDLRDVGLGSEMVCYKCYKKSKNKAKLIQYF